MVRGDLARRMAESGPSEADYAVLVPLSGAPNGRLLPHELLVAADGNRTGGVHEDTDPEVAGAGAVDPDEDVLVAVEPGLRPGHDDAAVDLLHDVEGSTTDANAFAEVVALVASADDDVRAKPADV